MLSMPIEAPIEPGGRSEPLTEQAYLRLREDILRADIAPGSRLKIDLLQERYGLSNTPLREALFRLVAERLVVADERRGFRVMPVSLEQFTDLTEFRYVVEEGALADAMRHGGDDWEAGIVAAYHCLVASEKRIGEERSTRHDEWRGRHKAFHMALFAGCSSRRLIETSAAVFDEAERYRCFAFNSPKSDRHGDDEHLRLLEAVLARDTRLATALLRNHVTKTCAHVIERLRQLPAAAGGG